MTSDHGVKLLSSKHDTSFWHALLPALILTIAPATTAWSAGWEMVFSDEFDQPTLDSNKWATRYIYQNETLDRFNDEKQRYRDNENHVLSNGVLSLVARKGNADLYESGMIRTHQTFYYGYYEARVFLPKGRGIWPAFWLIGDYDREGETWQPPEIDIFEYAVNEVEDKYNMLHSSVKGIGPPAPHTFLDDSYRTQLSAMVGQEDFNKGWHVAGLVWTPDAATFFWDGKRIYTRPYKWLRKGGKLGPPAQVVLNFAVGGGWAGRHGIDERAFPQEFKIDYVRVCQYTASERGGPRCGDNPSTPDPQVFGYSSDLRDMAKPTFQRVEAATDGPQPAGGAIQIPSGKSLETTITVKMPNDYPDDRTLRVLVYNDATSTLMTSRPFKLQASVQQDGTGLASIKLSLPPFFRPGSYRLEADVLMAGNRKVPVSCDTGVVQPTKALRCRLLIINQL